MIDGFQRALKRCQVMQRTPIIECEMLRGSILSRTKGITFVHDQCRVIWLGDLNYRINLPEATTRSLVKNKEWSILLHNDQLKAELAKTMSLRGGMRRKSKKKRRSPAWCDRIIWFGKELKKIQYNRGGMGLSDHRSVQAIFTVEVDVLSNKFDDL
ncbi:unnamed protein product [Fraxinus pennsylvanica]|uniref:Inositol polyphosphate-related phosphatase domain-containing protein n=1 Tax=Fraxinus pennsylvanica TaxID=56036 RepID=A0AAD2A2T1_9LAMI|nr:unnamed protein product [Fraxinus pennsylvanica]